MKIGIFDSGIGGISVLHEAMKCLPNEEYIFYADVDHVPYGRKKPAEIRCFADEIIKFFIDHNVDAIVIACNTATSVAAGYLRQKYSIPIIGMEPAVKPAVELTQERQEGHNRVLVMATPVTIHENKLHDLLEKFDTEHSCDLLPMPELVTFAENGIFETKEVMNYLNERYGTLPDPISDYSVVVLGCTHFNYFKKLYREIFGKDTALIDGNKGTVRYLAKVLGIKIENHCLSDFENTKVTYYMSGRKVKDTETLEYFKRLHEQLEKLCEV